MQEVRLGDSGLITSRLALGTMTFGLQTGEDESRRILDTALGAGITMIETADVYPYGGGFATVGITEELLGNWLPDIRDDVLVATKVGGQTGRHAWDIGASRKHLVDAVHACLRRLNTDYLDLVALHGFDTETPIAETLDTLSGLVRAGKIRYLGVSNFTAHQLGRYAAETERSRGVPVISSQPRYNLLARGIEREILPASRRLGIATMVYNPLAGGLLTGKHDRDRPPPADTRFGFGASAGTYQARYWTAASFDAVDAIREVATEAGIAMPELAMSWVLANPDIDVAILGASKPEHVTSAVRAMDTKLDDGTMARLAEVTDRFRYTDGVNAGLPRRKA